MFSNKQIMAVAFMGLMVGAVALEEGTGIVNNFTNITNISGGGGVSFNGDPVDLNGSNMFNGTISNYSTLTYVNDTFFKKSGGNLTGGFSLVKPLGYVGNVAGYQTAAANIIFTMAGRLFNETTIQIDQGSSPTFYGAVYTVRSTSTDARLEFNTLDPNVAGVTNQTNIWKVEKSATNDGGMTLFRQNGTLTITNLSGSGNDYVCVDANGKLFRSDAAC